MPLIAYEEKEFYTLLEVTYLPCTNTYTSGESYSIRRVEQQYNDQISRIKPQEPLFLYPTSLPLQFRQETNQGVWKKGPVTAGGILCYPPPPEPWGRIFAPGKQTTRGRYVLPAMGSAPETNWPLDLRLRIKDAKVNLASSIAEFDKTVEMFSNFSTGINGIWKAFVKKQPKRRRRKVTTCDVPASYLTATYGVEPLVGDLMDSINALDSRLLEPIYKRFSSKSKLVKTIGEEKWTVSDKAVVFLSCEPNESSKFTGGNIAEMAWERVPFSFVVDWGVGVGDYLSSLDALAGYKLHAGTVTSKVKMEAVYTEAEHHGYPDGLSGTVPITPCSRNYESHVRNVITEVPLPTRPNWEASASYRRLTNAVALLWAVNKKCAYRR